MELKNSQKVHPKYQKLFTPQQLELLNYKVVVESNQFDYVYEPNDDTYLMLSTLKQELDNFAPDLFICELGSGSGILSANLHNWLKLKHKTPEIHVSIDISIDASLLSQKYYQHYGLNIEQINASLFNNFNFSIAGGHSKPDIIIFNPPYVPVEQEQLDTEQQYLQNKLEYVRVNKASKRSKQLNMIAFSYMGGLDGLAVTRRILKQITWPCQFYFIVMGEQGLSQISQQIRSGEALSKNCKIQSQLQIMQYAQFYNEHLYVLRLRFVVQ